MQDGADVLGLGVSVFARMSSSRSPLPPHLLHRRPMFPGKYQFKFIIDDHWTYSADHQTVADGTHVNNCLEVLSRMDEEGSEKLRRYMSAGCVLTGGGVGVGVGLRGVCIAPTCTVCSRWCLVPTLRQPTK